MKRFAFIKIIILVLFNFVFNDDVLSWTEKTHENLSGYAAENSVLDKSKGDYLKTLGFNKGLDDEKLEWSGWKKLSIREWLAYGANLEDETTSLLPGYGVMRSVNHFHNPLKPWSDAGLDDEVIIPLPPFILHYTGESSLLWAQDGVNQNNHVGGDWSWNKVRQVYYWALISITDALRQVNFAQTFRGLGHQLHLIEDAAQPDHVRNDAHPEDSAGIGRSIHLEKWAGEKFSTLDNLKSFTSNLPSPVLFPEVALNVSYNNLAPITQFIDTKQYYNGGTPSTSLAQGIAEYTNANFASDDTIFTEEKPTDDKHYFPYPRKSSTNLQELINKNILPEPVIAEDGVQEPTLYIKKDKDGEIINRFLKPTYTATSRWDIVGGGQVYELGDFYRDDRCHYDYAQKLIPRAVGYSAGLLNYFFRGDIDITVPSNGVYSLIDGIQTQFTSIKLLAKNTTSNGDEMTDGSIQLVVKYKTAQADPFQSGPVPTSADFSYIVVPETNNTRSLSRTTAVELNFDLSQNPIPLWATDVYLQVVFKGTLGNENDAVAVGFKDISEPTPIDFTNIMDKICINGSWYNAGSSEAIAQVDANNDGIANEVDVYAHDKANFYVKFVPYSTTQIDIWASPTVYDFKVPSLTAGNHIRASYILSDYQFDYSIYNRAVVKKDPSDPWTHLDYLDGWIRTAIKRQKDYTEDSGLCSGLPSCYIDRYPEYSDHYPADGALVFYNFRNILLWWGGQLITFNWPYPLNSQCSYDLL